MKRFLSAADCDFVGSSILLPHGITIERRHKTRSEVYLEAQNQVRCTDDIIMRSLTMMRGEDVEMVLDEEVYLVDLFYGLCLVVMLLG